MDGAGQDMSRLYYSIRMRIALLNNRTTCSMHAAVGAALVVESIV